MGPKARRYLAGCRFRPDEFKKLSSERRLERPFAVGSVAFTLYSDERSCSIWVGGTKHMPIETLIVDDSDSFRRVLGGRLERLGCQIVGEARTAAEGLDLFRARNPRLVTLDLVMPGSEQMSADDLFLTIRQESPATTIVIISTHSRGLNASHFLSAGAVAYVEKTFMSFDQLSATLKGVFPELGEP